MDMLLPPSRTASARDLYDGDGMMMMIVMSEVIDWIYEAVGG